MLIFIDSQYNKLLDLINQVIFSNRKKRSDSVLGNVLVVSNTGFGDTILSTPAIQSLRKSFLNQKIIFLVIKSKNKMLKIAITAITT